MWKSAVLFKDNSQICYICAAGQYSAFESSYAIWCSSAVLRCLGPTCKNWDLSGKLDLNQPNAVS